jgi:hypothetical protein
MPPDSEPPAGGERHTPCPCHTSCSRPRQAWSSEITPDGPAGLGPTVPTLVGLGPTILASPPRGHGRLTGFHSNLRWKPPFPLL